MPAQPPVVTPKRKAYPSLPSLAIMALTFAAAASVNVAKGLVSIKNNITQRGQFVIPECFQEHSGVAILKQVHLGFDDAVIALGRNEVKFLHLPGSGSFSKKGGVHFVQDLTALDGAQVIAGRADDGPGAGEIPDVAAQKTPAAAAQGRPAQIDNGTGRDHDVKILVVPAVFVKKRIIAEKQRLG